MQQYDLKDFVTATATRFGIPGAAVGVSIDGKETFACSGVTSLENQLPVDDQTLFVAGSVTKPFTATAIMQLAFEGRLGLDQSVRSLIPELDDDRPADQYDVTVLQLLNHTSGLDWGVTFDTGEGDDALARYVTQLAHLARLAPPGQRFSYSQAGYNIAGRIIEKITGESYEAAVKRMLLDPVGLTHSYFMPAEVITRRFAVGHNRNDSGDLEVARLWRRWRGENPGGGLVISVSDLLHWAKFHLGEPHDETPHAILPRAWLDRMQEPRFRVRASNLGQAVGIGWFLREIDGVGSVGHVGSANGQFAELLFVPGRRFAVVSLANAGPDGIPFNRSVVRWTLQKYLGLADRDPVPVPYDPARAVELCGVYENEVMTLSIRNEPNKMILQVLMKPEIRMRSDKPLPPDHAPFEFGLLAGNSDEYIIVSGAFEGQRGYFTRDQSGQVTGVDLAGRLFSRNLQ